jgi:hypothetical protein
MSDLGFNQCLYGVLLEEDKKHGIDPTEEVLRIVYTLSGLSANLKSLQRG